MKSIHLGAFLMGILVLLSCDTQKKEQYNLKDNLIQKLIASAEAQSTKQQGKIIIANWGFCEQQDCNAYFQDYADKIQVYNKEDLFMRGIDSYLVLEKLDDRKREILGEVLNRPRQGRAKSKKSTFEIKL